MKILIVEDNAVELARAVKIAEEMGFEVITSSRAPEAARMVCKVWDLKNGSESSFTPLVDGVVTDIFMPYFEEGDKRHNADSPCGVLVAMAALAAKIPCVFCTGGYHHGSKFQWIQAMGSYMPVGMIDTGSGEEMDAPKKWKDALEGIKHWIEREQKQRQ